MASNDFDTLIGTLEIGERPGTLCYGKPWEFVAALKEIFSVSFPVNRNNKLVVVGNETPGSDEVDKLWARFDGSGNPLGWFAFVKGQWQRFYTAGQGEVRWFLGDSDNPAPGWQPLTSTASGISTSLLNKLTPQYEEISSGRYSYYAARYVGY